MTTTLTFGAGAPLNWPVKCIGCCSPGPLSKGQLAIRLAGEWEHPTEPSLLPAPSRLKWIDLNIEYPICRRCESYLAALSKYDEFASLPLIGVLLALIWGLASPLAQVWKPVLLGILSGATTWLAFHLLGSLARRQHNADRPPCLLGSGALIGGDSEKVSERVADVSSATFKLVFANDSYAAIFKHANFDSLANS